MDWEDVVKRIRYTEEGQKIIRIFNEYTKEMREIQEKSRTQEHAQKYIDAYAKHIGKLEDMFEIKE
tara:strand:+ start:405 stop:602 length:198 start_codon:yes stop_codon:yes gene_type:complete